MGRLTDREQVSVLGSTATLPCGLTLRNKLVKAAMEEMLGGMAGLPSELDVALYEVWAEGGWGMVITGNVQVSPSHLGSPFDNSVPTAFPPPPEPAAAFSRWADAARTPPSSFHAQHLAESPARTINITQLNHPGRQSMRFFCGRSPTSPALSASSIPMSAGRGTLGHWLGRALWGTPKEMSLEEIEEVVQAFVRGAKLAKATGWDGVELHASHGYLLAQFMSPKTNLRTDEYGGTGRKRLRLVFRIISAIRAEMPTEDGFCVGIKLNSSDYVKGGLTEQDALDNIMWLAQHGGVDFIEISGGSYENPEFMSTSSADQRCKRPSSAAREAFFDTFSQRARWLLSTLPPSTLPSPAPLILLTGGFRTRLGMTRALRSPTKSPPTADLVGLARPAAVDPLLPRRLLSPAVPAAEARAPRYDSLAGVRWLSWLFGWVAIAGPGLDVVWHTMAMRQVALRRREEKRRWRALYGEKAGDLVPVRDGTAGDAYPLSNFWLLGWRVYVTPVLPSWVVGVAGAVTVAAVGKSWSRF
ncbi:hypothetical protein JCM11641_006681 [Rhodosporidiobolus odoratus]